MEEKKKEEEDSRSNMLENETPGRFDFTTYEEVKEEIEDW